MLTLTVSFPDHCRRLESFLRNLIPEAQPGYGRKLIKSGAVRLNGAAVNPDTFLFAGDTVTLKESSALAALMRETRPPLDILFEDDRIAVVNKPAGLAMHRTAEREDNLVDLGMEYMERRDTPCKLYPVNRLDRGTSGVVVLAKSAASAGIYGRQVKETGLDKLYLALVEGVPTDSGVVNEPLDGKESETRFQVLAAGSGYALLAVVPVSGRMHQIRRHLEMAGHPVLGDKRYGSRELLDGGGFALHSLRTQLTRPNGQQLSVCAPLPETLLTRCKESGIETEALLMAVKSIVTTPVTKHLNLS